MQWWGCGNRTARQALATVAVLLALVVEPSLPFTLVRSLEPRTVRSAAGEHAGDAASVHGKLGGGDNGGGHSRALAGHPPPPLPPPRGGRRRQEQEGRGAASGEGLPTPDSTDGPATPLRPQAAGAEWRRPNRRGSYRLPTVSRRLGKTRPSESRSGQSREPDTEVSFNRRAGGPTALGESNRQQQLNSGVASGRSGDSSNNNNNNSNDGGGGGQSRGGGGNAARQQSLRKHQALPGSVRDDSLRSGGSDSIHLTQVVQVDLSGHVAQDRSSSSVGSSSGGVGVGSRNSASDVGTYSYRHDSSRSPSSGAHGSDVLLSVVVVDPGKAVRLRVGRSEALQQQVHHPADLHTHVPKMVLTVVGSVTAILGVCVMAAIFQCCCRRKRSGSSGSEEEEESSLKKEKVKERKDSGSRSSRSKSPSPQKVAVAKEGEEETEKGQSEQDKLLEEDEDLGDFSVVQRETEILRSYRKPPPPKNRARQSRVPRALKTMEPNASPNVFQELAESDEPDAKKSKRDNAKPAKPANGVTTEKDMHSSMLADIDNTLAALHSKDDNETPNSDPFPSTNVSRSREPSVEKALAVKPDSDSSRLKPPSSKEEVPSSPSREELARVLAQELSRSVSKEALAKPLSKTASPKTQSKETTPKSSSASVSPKLRSKDSSASENKDNVCSGNSSSSGGSDKAEMSPEEGDRKEPGNIFALIDPTIKDKETEAEDKSRSKIPVRAASSPTQPTAPLRQSLGKEKRFPVPSVHGEQMDQLLKSLKTRLKEDGSSPKRNSNKVSPEEDSTNDGLEPQARDRSHSDPSKQKEEKREKYHQTQL